MRMRTARRPSPGIEPRMPIASGCPGVSQTLTVAQSPRGAAAAEGGAAAASSAASAAKVAQTRPTPE
jgi:hypothetical protein